MANYSISSPWSNTVQNPTYLDIWEPRPIPYSTEDFQYVIQPQDNYRPDLLA
jgi:hypothetical protein